MLPQLQLHTAQTQKPSRSSSPAYSCRLAQFPGVAALVYFGVPASWHEFRLSLSFQSLSHVLYTQPNRAARLSEAENSGSGHLRVPENVHGTAFAASTQPANGPRPRRCRSARSGAAAASHRAGEFELSGFPPFGAGNFSASAISHNRPYSAVKV